MEEIAMSGDEALTGPGEGSLLEQAEQNGSWERAALALRGGFSPGSSPARLASQGPDLLRGQDRTQVNTASISRAK